MSKRSKTAGPKPTPFARQSAAYEKLPLLGAIERPADAPARSFGLKITGDCLAPRARDGQIVIVEEAKPQPGDLVVVWLKGANRPTVKVLSKPIYGYPHHPESDVVTIMEVEQLNPPRRYGVRLDNVECLARVHSVHDEKAMQS